MKKLIPKKEILLKLPIYDPYLRRGRGSRMAVKALNTVHAQRKPSNRTIIPRTGFEG